MKKFLYIFFFFFLINFYKIKKFIKNVQLLMFFVMSFIILLDIFISSHPVNCAPMESTFTMFNQEILNPNQEDVPLNKFKLNYILDDSIDTINTPSEIIEILSGSSDEEITSSKNQTTYFYSKNNQTFRFIDDYCTLNSSEGRLILIEEMLREGNTSGFEDSLIILKETEEQAYLVFGCGPIDQGIFYRESNYYTKNFRSDFKIEFLNIPQDDKLLKAISIIDLSNRFIEIIKFMTLDLKNIRTNINKTTFKLNNLEQYLFQSIKILEDILPIIDKKKSSKKKKTDNEIEYMIVQLKAILILTQDIKRKYGSSFLNKNILLEKDLDILFKKINKFALNFKKTLFLFIKYFLR